MGWVAWGGARRQFSRLCGIVLKVNTARVGRYNSKVAEVGLSVSSLFSQNPQKVPLEEIRTEEAQRASK